MNMKNTMMIALLTASMATIGGCSQQQTATEAPPQDAHTAAAQPQQGGNTFTGRVVETMDAGTYTYVRVAGEDREIWAAATKFDVAVGEEVVVPLEMEMRDFHSDTLNRDFPVIYFTSMIGRPGQAAGPAMPPGHPPISGAAAAEGGDASPPESVEPAAGGVAVAQVWADKENLAGSTVTVRGKVVKFNGGILGTNWIHLQDGTGDAAAGTHDITVTSASPATVGDVITVTGAVVVNQDFGAGYSYPVMIKDASIVVE